jgi:hypothetical protein
MLAEAPERGNDKRHSLNRLPRTDHGLAVYAEAFSPHILEPGQPAGPGHFLCCC